MISTTNNEKFPVNSIAVIGMAAKFPKSKSVEEFWKNISKGILCTRDFTDDELRDIGISESLLNNKKYVKVGAYFDDIDMFDADFFEMSPKEAEITSPQQRILLETGYHALQNAGYSPQKFRGSIGVYTSVGTNTYYTKNIQSNPDILKQVGRKTIQFGNEITFSSMQLSYALNLRGPSINLTTACSTSLVAIHLACRSLVNNECDIAVAGASNISPFHNVGYLYQEGGILANDGRCRPFSSDASGTVSGNGCGIIVLKKLDDAISDGDNIEGVILGTAINNDGRQKVGFSAPSVIGQALVVAEAQALSEVNPNDVTYVEAHGTATPLGDPVEVAALKESFSLGSNKRQYCGIGSLKGNYGHMGAASGVAGIIKVLCALKNKKIPPSINIYRENPELKLDDSPFYINRNLKDWPDGPKGRIAGVSSFGMGGTNAHIVVKEWCGSEFKKEIDDEHTIISISAKNLDSLKQMKKDLISFVESDESTLQDLGYTLHIGRDDFQYRCSFLGKDRKQILDQIKFSLDNNNKPITRNKILFMFSGQGSQYVNMGRELFMHFPIYRNHINRCVKILKNFEIDLHDLIYAWESEEKVLYLSQTENAQIALFCTEYALAHLLITWGINPDAMIGHSLGEYVAACVAEVISLDQALALIVKRGRLMQMAPHGKMISVCLANSELDDYIEMGCSVAAINAKRLCVLSGEPDLIDNIKNKLKLNGVGYHEVNNRHGFHSHLMEIISPEFQRAVEKVDLRPPKIPFISNVTGTWITDSQAVNPDYWVEHMNKTVMFSGGLKTISSEGNWNLLDVGPSAVMSTLSAITRSEENLLSNSNILMTMPGQKEKLGEVPCLLSALSTLWQLGVDVDWSEFYKGKKYQRIQAPPYPFNRRRYWIEEDKNYVADSGYETNSVQGEIYVPLWKQIPNIHRCDNSKPINYLLIGSNGDILNLFKNLIENRGDLVSIALLSNEGCKDSSSEYMVSADRNSFNFILRKEIENERPPERVLLLTGCDYNAESKIEHLKESFFEEFYCAWFLQQALSDNGLAKSGKASLFILGSGRSEITIEGTINPVSFPISTLCTVIKQEFNGYNCRYFDIDYSEFTGKSEASFRALIAEFSSDRNESPLAIKQGRCFQEYFSISPIDNEISKECLKKNGIYLITGGTGGIGMSLAKYLARSYQAKLILMVRGHSSDLEEDAVLMTDLAELKSYGGEYEIYYGDISDSSALKKCVEKAERVFGRLNGVIHSAGIAGGGLIAFKEKNEVEDVLRSKIYGTLNLLNYFDGYPSLDFMFLCSSQSAIKGGIGRADYGAANGFLDGLASAFANKKKYPLQSLNWAAWKDVGMAAKSKGNKENVQDNESITPEYGAEIFHRVVGNSLPRTVLSTLDFNYVVKAKNEELGKQISSKSTVQKSTVRNRPENISSKYEKPRNEIEEDIAEIWKSLLGIENIGINDYYFELGGTSLLLTQLVILLSDHFHIKVSLQHLLEAQTISSQANIVLFLHVDGSDVSDVEDIINELDVLDSNIATH